MVLLSIICSSFIFTSFIAPAYAANSVYIEDMTWMEVRDRLQAGTRTAIIPTGGTEQNGPHMAIGKHNVIARYTAGEIAKRLGNALVAPVIAYVPEGRISPPEGHMQFLGTMSVSPETFEALLTDAASSLKQHGFKLICFIGEHGGNQEMQAKVARELSEKWQSEGVTVLQVGDYYGNNGQELWTQTLGIKVPDPLAHAGFMDTSELMAIDALGVHSDLRGKHSERDYQATGAMGDSSHAGANYGRRLLSLKIEAAVEQIRTAVSRAQ
jgi:creatinine amidohydrolase/Fe(II)-dependent formamide hydrolase-like protein